MRLQAIKKRLLDLAIHGSLVPQIESEGTADDILQAIAKEQKTKTSFSEIPESEKPFSIPSSWRWVRLGDVCELITKGSSPSWQGVKYVDEGILFITSENVGNEELLLSKSKYLEPKFNEIQSRSILKKGDILTNIVGASIGRTAIFDLDIGNANINQAVAIIRLVNLDLSSYIVKVLNSQMIIAQMTDNTVNTARANISLTTVKNLLIPLPPLSEQTRIVTKLETMLTEIDEIEQGRKNIEALKATLRNKALQLAIEGKLVEQRAEEGDARALLDEIKAEKAQLIAEKKIKKDKPLAPIDDSEMPFDIPDSWVWVRLGEVCDKMISTKPTGEYFKYIDIDAIDNKICKIREPKKTLTKNAPSRATRHTQKGDVLFSMVRPYLKNIALVEEDGCIASTGFYVCRPFDGLFSLFLFELMTSEYVVNGLNKFMKGDNSPSINNVDIENLPIPLPPLGEQKRIVEKLDEVMAEIDKL